MVIAGVRKNEGEKKHRFIHPLHYFAVRVTTTVHRIRCLLACFLLLSIASYFFFFWLTEWLFMLRYSLSGRTSGVPIVTLRKQAIKTQRVELTMRRVKKKKEKYNFRVLCHFPWPTTCHMPYRCWKSEYVFTISHYFLGTAHTQHLVALEPR